MKDLSKIIKEFEKIGKLPYENKRTKHEPTHSYFHLARKIAKCTMISDQLNWHDHGGYMEITAPYLNVNDTSAEFLCDKFLLTMLCSDFLTSVEFFSDKVSCTMISFYSSSTYSD